MGFGTSIVLIAVGAILKWAITSSVSGIDLPTVGVILMICGILLLVLSLIFWSPWASPRRGVVARDRVDPYVDRDPRLP